MISIDNTALKSYCKNCSCQNFKPGANYDYSAMGKYIKITDTTVFDTDDTLLSMDVTVIDEDGKKVQQTVKVAGGSTTPLDISMMALTKKLTVTVKITSKGGCTSTGTIVLSADGKGKIIEWIINPVIVIA